MLGRVLDGYMSIRQKLVTSLVVIVIPVAILGIITFRLAEASLRSEVNLGLERLAVTSAERIDRRVESVMFEVENLGAEEWIAEAASSAQGSGAQSDTRLARRFVEVADLSYSVDDLTLVNTDGVVIASTDPTGESQKRAQALLPPATDGPVISESYVEDGERCVSIATAVYYRGALVGQLVADVSMDRLLMLSSPGQPTESDIVIELVEVGGEDAVLLSSGGEEGISLDASLPALSSTDDEDVVALVDGQNNAGVAIVSAYEGLQSGPWVLVASLDRQSAYSGLHGVRRALIVAFAVAIVGLFMAAMAIGSWLTRRLQRVSSAVEAVTRGDLSRRVVDPSDDELGKISQAFDTMADKLARRLSEERAMRTRLEQQAFFDALTGLPNRHSFESHIDRALNRSDRDGKDIGVLFLDLDGFKRVNDSVGHTVGDEVLRALSVRLGSSMRAFDTVARWGGDEFVVLCESIDSPSDAVIVAQRLIAEVEIPFEVVDQTQSISVSIGIAVGNGKTHTRQQLIDFADSAMYQAKGLGRSQCVMASPSGDFSVDVEGTRSRIKYAMDNGELRVDFQPVVSLDNGRLRGVEALVRWQDPEQGLVGADEIISSVTGSSIAPRLDEWVLRTSVSMFADWCRKYPSARELVLAVNIGVERLAEPGLEDWLRVELERNQLSAESLCVEIPDVWLTEGSRSGDGVIAGLAAMGVCVALDGSGPISDELFDDLKRHSITTVKLDRSLLRAANIDGGRNLEQVINNALARDLTVVAEGVESEPQLDLLRSFGCQLAQGYYFSKPLAVLAIEQQISVMETAEP